MDLPVETQLRWILRHTARLLELGAEPVSGLVLPTADFFPDRFDGSPESLAALTARVQKHAGLSDVPVELSIVTPEGEAQTVSCSSGACGGTGKIEARLDRVGRREDGSYAIALGAGEAKNPMVLTTTLVRAVATMFMTEAGGYDGIPARDREPLTDLAAALLGFGVLASNGSYIYMKGCGGVAVHSATRMPVEEVTVALAVFCKLHDVPERAASRYLELTPRECFDEGAVWASSNSSLINDLRAHPRIFEADKYAIAPARSWLARLLGSKKKSAAPEDDLAAMERALTEGGAPLFASGAPKRKAMDADKARKMAELRALVDESLEG
jgi:hypothetical protein